MSQLTSLIQSDFNPRSPYGERPFAPITAFHCGHFNPRSPYGERPDVGHMSRSIGRISIHAPLTGSDHNHNLGKVIIIYFNPRSPYGERHRAGAGNQRDGDFNPRSPYGERLQIYAATFSRMMISIHAPLTGSDSKLDFPHQVAPYFNPRSPYGERP